MSLAGDILKSKRLRTLLKAAFVILLLIFLGKKGFLSIEATKRAFTQWHLILASFTLFICTNFLGVIRWQLLLKAQGIRLGFWKTLELTLVGAFFNIALPGAVSGDVVKAIYVAKEIQGKRAHALSSILFDRVAGVSGLVLVSAGSLLISMGSNWAVDLFHSLEIFVLTSGAGVIFFFGYLLLVREHHDPLLKIFRSLEKKTPKAGSVVRIYEGLRNYHNEKSIILGSLGISIIIWMMIITGCLNFTWALGENQVLPLALFIVVPLGLLVTAIPVMPAGVGTGHAAFLGLYHLVGSARGADVFSLYVLMQLFMGAVGGLVYLRYRGGPEGTIESLPS